MQLLMNGSKYLVLALLSFIFLLGFYGTNIEIFDLMNSLQASVSTIDTNTTPSLSQQPQSAPAVVHDVVKNSVTASTSNTVWDSIGSELKLDHQVESREVQAEIRKILAEKDKLHSILKSAGPYIYFIHQQTQKRGLPAELALIPIIESEFNPNDHSNAGATGLWQLMPGTANELGVKVRSSYDGRRSVVASTKAALAYFRDLGGMFNNDWYLAMAAYNCGQVKVASAIRHSGSHNFWKLHLPRETKLYVPKLLAVAEIIKHPEKYGVTLPLVTNEPYFAEVKVKEPVKLSTVAESTGVSVETLHKLNPDYNHTPLPVKGVYSVLVPVNKASAMKEQFGNKVVSSST